MAAVAVGACGSRREDDARELMASPPATTIVSSVPVTTMAATTMAATTVGPTMATSAPASTTAPPTSAGATTTIADPAAAIAQITANWERFFLAGTPIAERETLLEDGLLYVEALTIRSADPLQAQAGAAVREVTLLDPEHAHVVYDVMLGETVALPGAEGTAVLRNGTWKVSAESFCSLIVLGATEPIPGCS